MASPKLCCFIDRGGTFTDCFCTFGEGRETALKVLSENLQHYPDSSLECVRLGLEWALGLSIPRGTKLPAHYIDEIRIGTTIATNALLERKGNRFGYITTMGFKDLLEIGSQSRVDIFDLKIDSQPTVLYQDVIELPERVVLIENSTKVKVELPLPNDDKIQLLLAPLLQKGIDSLAVALMHSAIFPHHEIRVGQVAKEMGFINVYLSHETMPMVRLVLRGNTVCADAYLTPKIQEFIQSFLNGFDAKVNVLFMRSDGGLERAESFSGHRAILSGPAGGVNGFARTAYHNLPVIGFDMGGTSTDVSRYAGQLELVFETTTAGITIQAPQLDIITVAAGGGSRLVFANGMFQVGPESAGSKPGPVCYRKPGGLLALTDANVVLGRLVPSQFPKVFGPNETSGIDSDAARDKFQEMIDMYQLSHLSVEQVALGFVRVANEAMCRPIREMTLSKGLDVTEHLLASFGGAGGQHCCAIARNLGVKCIAISRYAGVLSAVGLGLADIVEEAQLPASSVELTPTSLQQLTAELSLLQLECQTKLQLVGCDPSTIQYERFLHLRYAGTETSVPVLWQSTPHALLVEFERHHQSVYGFLLQRRQLLVDDIRCRARLPSRFQWPNSPSTTSLTVARITPEPLLQQRVFMGINNGTWIEHCNVYVVNANLFSCVIPGPAILLQGISTVLVEPYCVATVSAWGDIDIDLLPEPMTTFTSPTAQVDPIQLSLYAHRFMSIAEQMGKTLRQTAVSVNIKERLDFSCAVFAEDGGLVAHAPYIPVHLGAMSSAVRAQIDYWKEDIHPGDVLISNHPQLAGGSHLPDITVITPAFYENKVVFWIANRGHHSDIGGISPGSMPANSTLLVEEGAAIIAFKLVQGGEFNEQGITELLTKPACEWSTGTRNLADNLSDLKAQVAANVKGLSLVYALIAERTLPIVHNYMQHIRDHCNKCVQQLIHHKMNQLGTRLFAEDFMDDGSPIQLTVTLGAAPQPSAKFDFTGTGNQVIGNWNCPKAVTLSAIVYCLRCMIGESIPLNEGVMGSIQVVIPSQSLLDPASTSAVVGGNVLTSQRLCDVILKAFNACAASQGCMNNLTIGNDKFGYYETICGGAGAGPTFSGRSAVHTHMTNTRIGDPEIIEKRFPLLVRRFEIRQGSGGHGKFNGGNGCIREIEFRQNVTCSIVSERRALEPFGLHGGGNGQRGRNLWFSSQEQMWRNVGGKRTWQVGKGDLVRIETPGGGAFGSPSSRL
ncbi:hypothetical protein BASA81_006430 [Batrachochytrium salamandrivorans]|nr:hypothetical protein BASA81_006430 [Batrachochytrium salamandrivorans]